MNVVLIGYRCSGKTGVGKMLAHRLGREFVDTDALIEANSGSSIASVVDQKGWRYFRNMEKRVIREISKRDGLVIATGGGVVMDRENVENLERNGFLVWLKGDPKVLKERMIKEQQVGVFRPPLAGQDALDEIEQVLQRRTPHYEAAGKFAVDTSYMSLEDAAASIMNVLANNLSG